MGQAGKVYCLVGTFLAVSRWIGMVHTALCTDKHVKTVLYSCNPQLSAISTAILHTKDGNYTAVCSALNEYIMCMEPNITGCTSVLLEDYDVNLSTYSGKPYYCAIPTGAPKLWKVRRHQDHSASVSLHSDLTFTRFMQLVLRVTWLVFTFDMHRR